MGMKRLAGGFRGVSWSGRTALEQVEWLRVNDPKELQRILLAHGDEQAKFSDPFDYESDEEEEYFASLKAIPHAPGSTEWYAEFGRLKEARFQRRAKNAYPISEPIHDP